MDAIGHEGNVSIHDFRSEESKRRIPYLSEVRATTSNKNVKRKPCFSCYCVNSPPPPPHCPPANLSRLESIIPVSRPVLAPRAALPPPVVKTPGGISSVSAADNWPMGGRGGRGSGVRRGLVRRGRPSSCSHRPSGRG